MLSKQLIICGDYEPQSKQYGCTLSAMQEGKKQLTREALAAPYRRLERGALGCKDEKKRWFYGSMFLIFGYCLLRTLAIAL